VLAFADILRALKHHVLEQMCEAGSALSFIVRSDIVGNRNGVSGSGVIFRQHHAKPIVELELLNGNLGIFGLRLCLDKAHAERKHKYSGNTHRFLII